MFALNAQVDLTKETAEVRTTEGPGIYILERHSAATTNSGRGPMPGLKLQIRSSGRAGP